MTQALVMWAALFGGAVVSGAAFVGVLAARRSSEPIAAVLGVLGFVACAWGFGTVTSAYDRLDAVVYALIFAVAGVAGGYALSSTFLGGLSRKDRQAVLPSHLPDDPGSAAVLVLSEVEPAEYNVRDTASALDDLADEGLLTASVGVLPFLFLAQKTRYRAAGGTSQGTRQLESLAEKLCGLLDARVGVVQPASYEGAHSLVTRAADAVARGFRTIVVAEAVIADSLEIDKAKREVDALRLDTLGVSVSYTQPLWGSERIAAVVSSRIVAVAGDLAAAGVILVGQAQPEVREHDARSFDEQETAFLNRVRMLLVDRGVAESNVWIAWADWRTPQITTSVRHLAALGCRRIIVSPTCFPLDSITTYLDIPLAVRQARVDDSVSVVTLPGWQDDPALVEELRSGVVQLLGEAQAQA